MVDNSANLKGRSDISEATVQTELFNIFSKVIEQTSEIVVIINNDGMILHSNSRFEKFTGYSKDEAQGNSFRSFISEVQSKGALDFVLMTVKNKKSFSAEFAIRNKNNSVVYAEFMITPALDETSGKIIYYVATGRDVTERKKINEMLHKEDLLLRLLFEHISDTVIILAPDGSIKYITPCYINSNGNHISEDGKNKIYEFITEKSSAAVKKLLTDILSGLSENAAIEVEFNSPVKGAQLLEAQGRLYKNENETQVILICKNIQTRKEEEQQLESFKQNLQNELDDQKKEIQSAQERMNLEMSWRLEAEEELRLKEERLNLAIEVSDFGLWDLNFESGNLYYNEHFSDILGFEKGYTGKIDLDVYENMIPADDRQLFKQAFSDHVDNLTPKFEIEHRLIAATRKGKWLSVKGKVVERDESDNPIRFIGRVEDITQRKLIEKRIHSALEKEKELLDLKSYFISKVSHEFRTPLATILSSIEILENYYPQLKDAEKEKQFVTIHNCIDDLIEMLTDVITLNKPDLANPEAGMVKLELIGYVSQLIENVKQSFSKAPQIVFLPGAGSFSAKMNEKLLKQIIVNLLTNAIKYTPEDKTITIRMNCGSTLELIIADEGIGILPEDQKNIFEPFYRGKNVGRISGSGLGLSILKQSIDSLSGQIDFVSEPGVGTTFTVKLPAQAQDIH